jgi:hypothetical protein
MIRPSRLRHSSLFGLPSKYMGAFYSNITLTTPDQKGVVEALHGRRAVVVPGGGRYTVVFDFVCDEQDADAIEGLASRLSKEFACAALAVFVHDDDVFGYLLCERGELTDWYNSAPSYFDFNIAGSPAGPAGGDAARLCAVFGSGAPGAIEAILRIPAGSGYFSETERHRDLVHALASPSICVGTALASFYDGNLPCGFRAAQVMWAADPPPYETPQQRSDREFYERLGSEDLSRPCRRAGCTRGAIPNSVMCKRHHFEMIQRRDCPF